APAVFQWSVIHLAVSWVFSASVSVRTATFFGWKWKYCVVAWASWAFQPMKADPAGKIVGYLEEKARTLPPKVKNGMLFWVTYSLGESTRKAKIIATLSLSQRRFTLARVWAGSKASS